MFQVYNWQNMSEMNLDFEIEIRMMKQNTLLASIIMCSPICIEACKYLRSLINNRPCLCVRDSVLCVFVFMCLEIILTRCDRSVVRSFKFMLVWKAISHYLSKCETCRDK